MNGPNDGAEFCHCAPGEACEVHAQIRAEQRAHWRAECLAHGVDPDGVVTAAHVDRMMHALRTGEDRWTVFRELFPAKT